MGGDFCCELSFRANWGASGKRVPIKVFACVATSERKRAINTL